MYGRERSQQTTTRYQFPVPLVREIFEELGGKKVFTTLDLKSAYNRFLVHPDDQHKLTFTHNN